MTLPRIFHNLPCIILCIISSVCARSIFCTILTAPLPPCFPVRIRTISCLLRQFRIAFNFQTPASTICQMPMKGVQLIACHGIQLFLYKFFGSEMTGYVLVQTSVSKTRSIFDINQWQGIGTVCIGICQLQQCLKAIKQPGTGRSRHNNTF